MESSAITALYAAAKRKAWNVDTELDWSNRVLHQDFPVAKEINPFVGFTPYEALPRSRRVNIAWQLHLAEIRDILRGESAALTLCAQLLGHTDDTAERLFLSAQVSDEARHVEFFTRYLDTVSVRQREPSVALERLLNRAVHGGSVLRKLLVCQVIIESLAMARFRVLRRTARAPVLIQALRLIAADEARHVKFGTLFLRAEGQQLTDRQRRAALAFVRQAVTRLAADMDTVLQIGDEQGFDHRALLHHLRRRRVAGQTTAWSDELNRNLRDAGLLTDSVRFFFQPQSSSHSQFNSKPHSQSH